MNDNFTERHNLGLVDAMIQYENGTIDKDAELEFFQHLINTGLAWTLQHHYGEQAQAYINAGLCEEQPKGM